jgi:hypothetical protein
MPIKNGTVFCINHPDTAMIRNSGFNAITTVERTDSGFIFIPTSGMPLVAYFCNECGYVESYAAQKTRFWSESEITVGTISERLRRFEDEVIQALKAPDGPFGQAEVQPNLRLETGLGWADVDAVVRAETGIYILEIKASSSRRQLESAAAQVRNHVDVYRSHILKRGQRLPVFPIIVAPAEAKVTDDVFGVPVLKFDPVIRTFVNRDNVFNILRDMSRSLFNQ